MPRNDPNRNREILNLSAIDENFMPDLMEQMKIHPDIAKLYFEISRPEVANENIFKDIIREFSGLSIRTPLDGAMDIQIVEHSTVGMEIAFLPGSLVVIAFHVPMEPGERVFKPLIIEDLELRLVDDYKNILQAKTKSPEGGFLFQTSPGDKHRLEITKK